MQRFGNGLTIKLVRALVRKLHMECQLGPAKTIATKNRHKAHTDYD